MLQVLLIADEDGLFTLIPLYILGGGAALVFFENETG